MVCVCGYCIPDTVLFSLLMLFLKPILDYLGLFQSTKKNISSSPSCAAEIAASPATDCCKESSESDCIASDDMNWEELIGSEDLTCVKYTATWCRPCQSIAPLYDAAIEQAKTSVEFANARFITVDIDACPQIAAASGVFSIPALHAYQRGKLLSSSTPRSEEDIHAFMQTVGKRAEDQ